MEYQEFREANIGSVVVVPYVWINELKNAPYVDTTYNRGLSDLWQEGDCVIYACGQLVEKIDIGYPTALTRVKVFTEPENPCFSHDIPVSDTDNIDVEDWREGQGEDFFNYWTFTRDVKYGKFEQTYNIVNTHLIDVRALCKKLLPEEVLKGEKALEDYTEEQAQEEAAEYDAKPYFTNGYGYWLHQLCFLKKEGLLSL